MAEQIQEWVYSGNILNRRGLTHPLKRGNVLIKRLDSTRVQVDTFILPLPTPDMPKWEESVEKIKHNHSITIDAVKKQQYQALIYFARLEKEYDVHRDDLLIRID